MTTLDDAPPVDGMVVVVSSSGSQYTVDLYGKACECPDFRHRDYVSPCNHIRRAAYATGAMPVPGWVNRDVLDDHLGEHVDGCPRVGQVATDGSGLAADRDEEESNERPESCDCPTSVEPESSPC